MSFLPILLFASGFAGLVYQVLWQKQLGYLLGSSAHATATAVAVFFLGLTLGQLWAGRIAAGLTRPLATWAWLEAAIAAAALSYFALDPVLQMAFPPLFALLGDGMLLGPARAALAALVLLPAATLMGATLPVLAEAVGRRSRSVAGSVAGLYAANTFGAAAGAFAAGFWLPQALGLRGAYTVAIGITFCVGAVAWVLAGRAAEVVEAPAQRPAAGRRLPASAALLALLSGFLALALQVLWTRMFAQVLHNSVYSFAAILVVFLAALALGAWGARLLARRAVAPEPTLGVLLLASGVTVAASPLVFFALTDGLGYVARDEAWAVYVLRVFALAATVVGIPCTVLGLVFPYLLKVYERRDRPGELVGQLAAANTVGAIAGSVLAGFVLLPFLGLWVSLRLIAVLYLGAAVWAAGRAGAARRGIVASACVALLLLLTIADPGRLPAVRLDAERGEALLSLREGAYGTVAVVARGDDRRIKLDNFYTVGGTGSVANDRRQADLPLLIAAHARSAFFLGIGSGITAGAAVLHPLERIVAAELVPEIAAAADEYFAAHAQGLFTDPRVEIVLADGRNLLRARPERFDAIVSDLFTPWQAGAASLYTREHFRTVRSRLTAGGVFAQWLPLYQMSEREFAIVARTMLAVFPQVTLWRGEFLPQAPIVALVGHAEATALDPAALLARLRQLPAMKDVPEDVGLALVMLFYAGNLTLAPELLGDVPLNTDDRPVIEYLAPRTQRAAVSGEGQWFVGMEFVDFLDRLAAAAPPGSDPFLAGADPQLREFVRAGADLGRAVALADAGRIAPAQEAIESFFERVPLPVYRMFRRQLEERLPRLFDPTPS